MPAKLHCVDALMEKYCTEPASAPPADLSVAVAFITDQAAQHAGRNQQYRNQVLSVRVGTAVGSCSIEPGSLDHATILDCAGAPVEQLLRHESRAVRIAVLDAYLAHTCPHRDDSRCVALPLPSGDSLFRSMRRARHVTGLVPVVPGERVLVVGVVNSLLACLRERDVHYVACDLRGGRTEWDEPIVTDLTSALPTCDAVLATGMMLGNGTFDALCEAATSAGTPITVFAQSGSAVARELLGGAVHSLSAEPYPFFWLTGDGGEMYLYPGENPR
jgi:hypothetical protein